MSLGRRAYDLLRAYVNHEWERIQGIERYEALDELESPSRAAQPVASPQSAPVTKGNSLIQQPLPAEQQRELACRILGVSQRASFEIIRRAFERLHERSDPSRFPEESDEQKAAAEIHRRVNTAYKILTDSVTVTEKRFGTLEIEKERA